MLSSNPNAIHLLVQKPHRINWRNLSRNPNAIHLLEQNQDKIDWSMFSGNLSIFEYDYQAMRSHMYNSDFFRELMANRFHPDNMHKFGDWGFEDMVPDIVID